jgi:bifunctional DNA-binding transcriptional regulator/antitoxin component of YhaV-PrlF toxin-antitoxin module
MTTATISSKSQITLPAAACRRVGLKPHDRVLDFLKMSGLLGKALSRDAEARLMAAHLAKRHKATP